ncbi:tRNA (adenosine(37)-N6)-threonylcarbamoyltransferase complex transferase subunit TsaD [Candidatus Saccharibacteria bacterium]|nr:tRNA (adenosine(37)-N6)-threonylcarbamoyltransferase complex transferase subunit TsaD [Candidatus Saccharibacteria bacterium]
MKILAIESSCDETAAAIVEDGTKILSNVVVSQIDIFAEYGGVIPEVAARSHLEAILPVIHKALKEAGATWDDVDAIAVTHTPGLLGSLLIGTLTARTLAILHHKPLYAIHHLKSHIYACWLENACSEQPGHLLSRGIRSHDEDEATSPVTTGARSVPRKNVAQLDEPTFPLLALVVSGGHTQILYMKQHNHFEIIGTTHDDAVGECFDKIAKILGLPYPGGPSIAKQAENGDENRYKFPHPKVNDLDFSFSGLKTAVLRAIQKEVGVPISYPSHQLAELLTEKQKSDFAASFQKTAVDILLEKLNLAKAKYKEAKSIVIAGGVSANQKLRKEAIQSFGGSKSVVQPKEKNQEMNKVFFSGHPQLLRGRSEEPREDERDERPEKNTLSFPQSRFSGDNAAMVGAAAYFEIKSGVEPTDPYSLNIAPRSDIN